MTVVSLVERISPEVQIDYAQFLVTDPEAGWAPFEWDGVAWCVPLATGAVLISWGDVHYPKITVEIWTGPPPPVEGFERTAESEVLFPSRTARLESVMGDVSESWSLPRARMRMRVSSRGKAAVLAVTDGLPARHSEEWIISFY